MLRRSGYLFALTFVFFSILACGPASLLGGGPGGLDSPIAAGQPMAYKWGTLSIVNFQRPTSFVVVKADIETTGITDDTPAQPAVGAEFVALELSFVCAADQTSCETPPNAKLELVLDDGRIVEENHAPYWETWLGEQAVAGGGTINGWVVFEVPVGVNVKAFKVTAFEDGTEVLGAESVHGALPAAVDGFTITQAWKPLDGGGEELAIPTFRRELEQAGFVMLWAGLYRDSGDTGLYLTTLTDDLFFFDDAAAIAEAQPALLAAAPSWPAYKQDATYLAVDMGNTITDKIIATVGADAADVEAYLSGSLDEAAFMQRWWVQTYD
jgi:hypothetical protein